MKTRIGKDLYYVTNPEPGVDYALTIERAGKWGRTTDAFVKLRDGFDDANAATWVVVDAHADREADFARLVRVLKQKAEYLGHARVCMPRTDWQALDFPPYSVAAAFAERGFRPAPGRCRLGWVTDRAARRLHDQSAARRPARKYAPSLAGIKGPKAARAAAEADYLAYLRRRVLRG